MIILNMALSSSPMISPTQSARTTTLYVVPLGGRVHHRSDPPTHRIQTSRLMCCLINRCRLSWEGEPQRLDSQFELRRVQCSSHDAPLTDGVRTNGVVAEVPRFPVNNVHGEMWAARGKVWQTMSACAHLKQRMAACRGFVALLWKPRLSQPRLETGDSDIIRIDRFVALSWFYGWWCRAVLSWWSDLSG